MAQDNFINKWVFPKSDDLEEQVGRDKNADINLIVNDIATILDILPKDTILDTCCGNGIITFEIAKMCEKIYGVDFSETLINTAKAKNNSENISYNLSNALDIDKIFPDNFFDKSYLYFSFQYFNYNSGKKIIELMSQKTKPGGKIFIGDIPNKKKISVYYNTKRKRLRYLKNRILRKIFHKEGEDSLGWWWHPKAIENICKKLGLKCLIFEQDSKMLYSHYRFDVLIINSKKIVKG